MASIISLPSTSTAGPQPPTKEIRLISVSKISFIPKEIALILSCISSKVTFFSFSFNNLTRKDVRLNPKATFKIFLISSTPIIIPTVSISRLPKNSSIPAITWLQSTFSNAVSSVSHSPKTQTLILSAKEAKSNVLKNSLILLAMESPKFVQSKSDPKASAR